ncbi:hypothetical protein I6F48_00375 [Pseudoalteromonas sp. SWYJ118]|uniref:hypothetical protein n=1 Tax=Pseudoalteromonas sp. SWYJ118 TaxID=2792062 RepID=UPI0018CCA02A|nr:hypothetical protein [Pseudoalteromonas sp. SWYJ118]MBH0074019.1 hypothetical protein [Pseudoalteromonas sp. SWYJ118]
MSSHKLALTDLVKSLGFNSSSAISNKIRDILKEKEDFKTRFIIDERNDYESENNRVEKTYVSEEAKIIVDNLAILLQYSGLFGRGTSNTLAAYRELLKGVDEGYFKSKVIKQTHTFKQSVERSKSSLKELPIFSNAILAKKPIDITKDSLRELMQEQTNNSEILDLTNTFELSAWNELLGYQEELEQGEDHSSIYHKIGEKFFELGDNEQALTALITSTGLDPKNGIAWAITSLIYHSRLKENKHSHFQALARNDFSEAIEHPLTSEEHWVNERIEDTYNDIIDVNSQFVSCAINALIYWPVWDYSKTEEKPNHFYNLNQSHDTNVEVERRYLFIKLINEISFNQFELHKKEMVEIVRSFQRWEPELYPQTNLIHDINNNDKSNLMRILSWISDADIKNALNSYFANILNNSYRAHDDLALLKDGAVQSLYRKHIGKNEYRKTLSTLLKLDIENQEIDIFNKLSSPHFFEVHSQLTAVIKKLEIESRYGKIPPTCYLEDIKLTDEGVELALAKALKNSDGWYDYLSEQAWVNYPYSRDIHFNFYGLALLSILLELGKVKNIERNIEFLNELCENNIAMRSSLSRLPTELYTELVKRIDEETMEKSNRDKLLLCLEIIFELRCVLDDEEDEYNATFD